MPKKLDNPVVLVSVTVDKDAKGNVNITCTPDPVPVAGFNSLIAFQLRTPGYRFKTVNAVELDAPAGDFPNPSWTVSTQTAMLYDLCTSDATYPYTVRIVDTITDVEYSVDPEIKNGDQT